MSNVYAEDNEGVEYASTVPSEDSMHECLT